MTASGRGMRRVLIVPICSSAMVVVSTLLMLVTPKMAAAALGSVAASIILTMLSLKRGTSFGDLLSSGTAIAVIGSFLLNVIYYLALGYARELCGVRGAIETFVMILRSGVFFYMFVLDLIVSFTTILLVISIVSVMFIGE